jgi:hypothetical protein
VPRWLAFVVACVVVACGGHPPPPPRGVMESDLGEWKFRRFQPLLDVEVWVKDNKAEAYTATYVNDRAEREHPTRLEDKDLVNVFVTRYAKPDGVVTIAGHDEWWAMWAAPSTVVKVGGRGRTNAPADLVKSYGERYPSLLAGGVLEGPLPPGPAEPPPKNPGDDKYDPNNPTPDWKGYDPSKAKVPTPPPK